MCRMQELLAAGVARSVSSSRIWGTCSSRSNRNSCGSRNQVQITASVLQRVLAWLLFVHLTWLAQQENMVLCLLGRS